MSFQATQGALFKHNAQLRHEIQFSIMMQMFNFVRTFATFSYSDVIEKLFNIVYITP